MASSQRLVLAQEAVEAKDSECAAILGRLDLKGALVTIDAIATNPTVAQAITEAGGDYVLALKRNQPTLHAEVETCVTDPATSGLKAVTTIEKDHGRIETRTTRVSHGAQNMALVRRLAFNVVRAGCGKRSIKTARKVAGWSTDYLASLIQMHTR